MVLGIRSKYLEVGLLKQHAPKELIAETFPPQQISANKLKISIVTPSFNQAQFIEETVRSILDQNYSNLEYIIQDGASTDGTDKVLSKYVDLANIEIKKDAGQTAALNQGFAKSTGDILAYLNSDDLLSIGTLEYVNYMFNKYPDVDVIYGNRIIIDENSKQIGRWILSAFDRDLLTKADYIPQETMFWRRRAWEKVGSKFDENFKFAMDWNLISRFIKANMKFKHVPYFLGIFRVHSTQKTTTQIHLIGLKESLKIMSDFHGSSATVDMMKDTLITYRKTCAVNSMLFGLFKIRTSRRFPLLGKCLFSW